MGIPMAQGGLSEDEVIQRSSPHSTGMGGVQGLAQLSLWEDSWYQGFQRGKKARMKSSSRRGGLIYRKGFRNGVTKAMRAYSRGKVEETRKGHSNPVGPKEIVGLQL